MDDDHENRIKMLEGIIATLVGSSQIQFTKDAKFYDGRNIQLGLQSGTMIGTTPAQKLGFFGTKPVVQHASAPVTLADVIALLQAYGLTK